MIHVLFLVIAMCPPLQIPLLPLLVHEVDFSIFFVVLVLVVVVNELLDLVWGRARVVILVRVFLRVGDVAYRGQQVGMRLVVVWSVLLFHVV